MSSEELAQRERQLKLLLALDDVRDSITDDDDPLAMFQWIARRLKKHFEADACAIILVTDLDEIEAVSAVGIPDDMALELCREALTFTHPTALSSSAWAHTLGFQVVMDEDHSPLGSIFIGRKEQPFKDGDVQLLELAESQIDSAVIQARTLWKLAQRNRELEAIYEIDRLRDDSRDENDLINGFTAIVLRHFEADLCMVILSHTESGELLLRGIINKQDLPAAALQDIRAMTKDLQAPQIIPVPDELKELDLFLMAAPFVVSNQRLGAVVIGRKKEFSIPDHRLLYAMMSQMDSAIIYSRTQFQLAQRKRELETIYRIDQIRDKVDDFDTMLQQVLVELCRVISSEIGYLMLYNNDQDEPLELRATTTQSDLLSQPNYIDAIRQVSREAMGHEGLVYHNTPIGPIDSIIATPLILNDQIIGVFGAINSGNKQGFDSEDRRLLGAITSQVDTAVFERLERRRMRRVLSRSVDPKVLDALLQRADDSILHGERVVLSILFADLRGSTEWAERTEPEELVHILNTFLATMTDIIFKHGGTLDKFVGDEVIALFGSPLHMDDHAYHAALTAVEMQTAHRRLQREFGAMEQELPAMGIGVSTGEVIAGEFGPPIRTDFTAMGRVMNLGARLCSAAEGHQIIISQSTRDMLGDRGQYDTLDPITPKGISKPVQVFSLLSIDGYQNE